MGREETPVSITAGDDRWVLMNTLAYIDDKHNPTTTATDSTRNGLPIHASLWRERPPLPSKLYVSCSDTTSSENPRILCMVDDLILFRIRVGPPCLISSRLMSDYYIYRADPERPSLKLLPHPQGCFFRDDEAGILPCGDDHYAIAALVPVRNPATQFQFHLFDSKTGSWSSKLLSVVESPKREFPVEIPSGRYYMFWHKTNTVITLGGKGGTMAWVDLWRGIVLCDVLDEKHTLRGVPVPMPVNLLNSDNEHFGHARQSRGIAFVNGALKFVDLEFDMARLPYIDDETRRPAFQMDSWKITTWTNREMSGSYDDWLVDCTAEASDIAVTNQMEMEMPELLQQHGLQSLFVSDPAPSIEGDDVVYLTARMKFLHPKSWVLALDLRNHTVQGVVESGPHPRRIPRIDTMYCPCSISAPVSGGTLDPEEPSGCGERAA